MSLKRTQQAAGASGVGQGRLVGEASPGWGSEAALPFARSVTFALLCAPLSSSVKWAARFPWREEITWGIKKSPGDYTD